MPRTFIFELSKEHQTLPSAEALACLQAEQIPFELIEQNENVLLTRTAASQQKISEVAHRLSHSFYLDEFLCSSSPSLKQIQRCVNNNPLKKKGSLAIRCKNRSSTQDTLPILEIIADTYTNGRTVHLQNPDIELRVLITENTVYIGRKLFEISRKTFEQRKVQHRPFFSPISMHPKLARALVNLSRVRKDETLLDPFCGTGGILIEAALINARVIGNDIEKKMIDGCKKTFEFYKLKNSTFFCTDIGNLSHFVNTVDSIVTDFPYGRATTTKGEELSHLYERAFKEMHAMLKKGRYAVVGLSHKELIDIGSRYFSLEEIFSIKVHRSLTRHFAIYQK